MKQKRLLSVLVISGVIILIGIGGYFISDQPTVSSIPAPAVPNQESVSTNKIDVCELISNSTFRSISQHEVGLGPDGPVMGYWGIKFKKSDPLSSYNQQTFQWHHSDVVESGSYTCRGNILEVRLSNTSFSAHYDENKETLIWAEVEYKQAERN